MTCVYTIIDTGGQVPCVALSDMINIDDVLIPLTKLQKTILSALHVPIEALTPATQ